MSDSVRFALTLVSALGCGLSAGAFFAFSTFVMKALARLSPAQGIAAMQSINVAAINPAFMLVLFGPAVTCVLLAGSALFGRPGPDSAYRLAGSLLYVFGTVLVTLVFNVPRNNALAVVDPAGRDGERLWADYVVTWTAWNHVRTAAAFAASAALIMALLSD